MDRGGYPTTFPGPLSARVLARSVDSESNTYHTAHSQKREVEVTSFFFVLFGSGKNSESYVFWKRFGKSRCACGVVHEKKINAVVFSGNRIEVA